LRAVAKATLELLQPSNQSLHARGRGVIDQCATGYRKRVKSTMSSKPITRDSDSEISDLTKSNSQGDDYLKWVCQFKGGTLTGRFSADFSMFEADETLIWGPPVSETTVYRRWVVSR
jgi:hypothetical protein